MKFIARWNSLRQGRVQPIVKPRRRRHLVDFFRLK